MNNIQRLSVFEINILKVFDGAVLRSENIEIWNKIYKEQRDVDIQNEEKYTIAMTCE